jgi:hypothetical protein
MTGDGVPVTNESARFYVIATLWVQGCDIPRFEAYERKALSIAQRHSGRLERAIRVMKDPGGTGEGPFEVHVLSFFHRMRSSHSFGQILNLLRFRTNARE